MAVDYTKLVGTWFIKGTNFPMWLTNQRQVPPITYQWIGENPIQVSDLVEYETRGKTKRIKGIDTLNEGQFVWRGKGIVNVLSSRWCIVGIKDDILVIRFEKSLVTPAGVDVLLREGADDSQLKQHIFENYGQFGLTKDELLSLMWL
ncbi:MAG: hypothetical protein ACK5NA_07635 [Enterococcus sp.]